MRLFIMRDRIVTSTILLLIILILNSVLINCKRPYENTNQNIPFKLEIENCNTLIDLKLSDLIDSCWLVSLETTNESLLGDFYRYFYLTNDYIIVDDINGIYLFAADGSFINKIIHVGRGPQEISVSHSCYYYEKEDLLLINDRFNNENKLLCYDIKAQTFQNPIKKCFSDQWGEFMVYNDSIIGSLSGMDAGPNPFGIFFQDFNGNFVSGIESKRRCISLQNQEVLQRMLLYFGNNEIHVKYTYDDTLFALNNKRLSPYLIAQYNSPQSDPPHMIPEIGEKKCHFERFENSSFIIFWNQSLKGFIPFNAGKKADYNKVFFFLNKSNGNYGVIKSYTDDFIGKIETSESETIHFPTSLPNNKIYIVYYAHELLGITSSNQVSKEYPKSLYSQLSKIKGNLSVTDNPVLLIGIPKKRIRVKNL